jgi:hypothetical protein
MSQLSSDLAERHVPPDAPPGDASATRASHLAERAAQGLPAHLEDPAVAARIVALLLPAGSLTTPPSCRRAPPQRPIPEVRGDETPLPPSGRPPARRRDGHVARPLAAATTTGGTTDA